MNIQELTVSELVNSLKITIEDTFPFVRVRGEIGEISRPSSGHIYLHLKDREAVLKCVCWKDKKINLAKDMEIGAEVVCAGTISLYPQSSCYQLIIYKMDYASQGAIMAAIEQRRQRLEREGLFDPGQKKPIPRMPSSIGIITSPQGAVIQDMLHRIRNRFPCKVVIFPAVMQGANCAKQVIAGARYFASNPTDVLIIARGGGSIEELMPFNSEELVREIFKCKIPTISAIGHETNLMLIDYVADLRAPTPTAAAELATPSAIDLKLHLGAILANIKNHCNIQLRAASYNLNDNRSAVLAEMKKLFYEQTARLSILGSGLGAVSQKKLQHAICKLYDCKHKNALSKNSLLLKIQNLLSALERQHFLRKIVMLQLDLCIARTKLTTARKNKLKNHILLFQLVLRNKLITLRHFALMYDNKTEHRLDRALIKLRASNPSKIINEGLIRVYNKNNQAITSALLAQQSKEIRLEFADDSITASVLHKAKNSLRSSQD